MRRVIRKEKHRLAACSEVFDKAYCKGEGNAAEIYCAVHIKYEKLFIFDDIGIGITKIHEKLLKFDLFSNNIITYH